MADTYKQLLDTLDIPAPSEGLEQRIVRAANHARYRSASSFRLLTPFRISLMALTASLALVWVLPAGMLGTSSVTENGTAQLVESVFDEEMDKEWGEQWLEVAFSGS